MMYAYSDSTSPTPVTDGKSVCFTNASGRIGCWDFEGKKIWERRFEPWGKPYPFREPAREARLELPARNRQADGQDALDRRRCDHRLLHVRHGAFPTVW
jgi:hypothetical protein